MIVAIQGLTKAHVRGQPVFADLTFELDSQVRTALVGESGCGKSTLLRVLSGLTEPDAGTVTVDGRVVGAPGIPVPAARVGIGMVFQEAALFPHLTVAQNIAFGLGKRADRHQRVQEFLELVHLPGLGGRYPHQLSGGQQQRVALARALAPEPGFLLLDEPFSGLDRRIREQLGADLAELFHRLGTGVLLVTHEAEDARRLAPRVLELRGGGISSV